jgi:eukaryotic-like serine/threonine-protein kinase
LGIVHRDIKPENVMLRPDGFVKVLDFGLAKLAPSPGEIAGADSTHMVLKTEAGVVVGTAAYMSPEQARGQEVDARTDIWSLGVLLYEMVAGRSPFAAPSGTEVLAAILDRDPLPLARFDPDVPAELQRIVTKCLKKERALRYQIVQDLVLDLQALREELPAHARGSVTDARTEPPVEPVPLSGVSGDVTPASRGTRSRVVVGAAGAVLVAVALGGTWWWLGKRQAASDTAGAQVRRSPPIRVVPLTTLTGAEDYPAFSPNGEEVVFSWRSLGVGRFSTAREVERHANLYVTLVGSTDVRRLTAAAANDWSATYSPDGRQIAFLRNNSPHWQIGNSAAETTRIHLVSVVGGAAVKVSDFSATEGLAWSPDGRSLVAGRDGADSGLFLVPLNGGEPRAVTQANAPAHHLYPAVSPDGHRLAYVSCRRSDPLFFDCAVETVNVDDRMVRTSDPRRLTAMPLIRGVAWSRDNQSILFAADEVGSQALYLWRVDVGTGGPAERIEAAGMNIGGVATARSRDRVAFARHVGDDDVFQFRAGRSEALISSSFLDSTAKYSNDGRSIAFCSDRSGTIELWVAAADGSSARQVTRGPNSHQCSGAWSPDDSQIAFDSQSRDGQWHIWTIGVDGGPARQLTFGPGDQNVPFWSQNGEWIYFAVDHGRAIARVRSTGGPPEDVTSGGSGLVGFESIDGNVLLYQPRKTDSPLLALPLGGGRVTQVLPCVKAGTFAVARKGIYYVPCEAGVNTPVHVFDTVTRRDRLFASLPGYQAYEGWALAVTPDGTTIAYTRSVEQRGDLMLIENYR